MEAREGRRLVGIWPEIRRRLVGIWPSSGGGWSASYYTVYKAKLADGGGNIELRLLREGSYKDAASCGPAVRRIGRARHENLVPLRAFYQGRRGEKLLVYDYFPHRTLHGGGGGLESRPALTWPRRHKIENQYFLGSSYAWWRDDGVTVEDINALHLIPKELSLKIASSPSHRICPAAVPLTSLSPGRAFPSPLTQLGDKKRWPWLDR